MYFSFLQVHNDQEHALLLTSVCLGIFVCWFLFALDFFLFFKFCFIVYLQSF